MGSVQYDEVVLDGESLTPEKLLAIGSGKTKASLSGEAWKRVEDGRKVIDDMLKTGKPIYGVNTGFGNFQNVFLPADQLQALQRNLIRSHAAGVGAPLDIVKTRMLLALRINTLSKGFSGARRTTIETLLKCLNLSLLSKVPEQGTVGASGDLAPLAHLALGMLGEGDMWDPQLEAYHPAAEVLKKYGVEPLDLMEKEGLALINGTTMMTALLAFAVAHARIAIETADVIAAMSIEALRGNHAPFDERIHLARPHKGQMECAAHMRKLLGMSKESRIFSEHIHAVQDSYTLRCIPQVHGAARDIVDFVYNTCLVELNSATDNPMVFGPQDGEELGCLVSGGNFHGEIPAKAADILAIGISDLGNMSNRRFARMIDPNLSGPAVPADKVALSFKLPAFLVEAGGLNSGFMMAECTSAALASENKVLCHPSSVDSIPTSCNQEDHVSMGGWAARKCCKVIENVETVLAIELLAACQGLEYVHKKCGLTSTAVLEDVLARVRKDVKYWDQDRFMSPDIAKAITLVRDGAVLEVVHRHQI